jgi:phosphopantetheinyl transferase (holo-ACP synthase)
VIGNDVIDLELAKTESNWRRKGFLDKIFTASEQLLIGKAKNQETMVWALWSRKEAAYKIFNRETRIRAYNPLQFECSEMEFIDDNYFGKVIGNKMCYYTKTQIGLGSIHTIAVSNASDFDKVYTLENNSAIQKTDGIPEIYDLKSVIRPVSISHHGRFKKIISI